MLQINNTGVMALLSDPVAIAIITGITSVSTAVLNWLINKPKWHKQNETLKDIQRNIITPSQEYEIVEHEIKRTPTEQADSKPRDTQPRRIL